MDVQNKQAYQKQPIFQATKTRSAGSAKRLGKEKRWYKDVGLGFKVRERCVVISLRLMYTIPAAQTPKEAIDGTYIGAFVGP